MESLDRREVLAGAAAAVDATALPTVPTAAKRAWLAAAEAEIASSTNSWEATLWFARGFPLTVIGNAQGAGRNPAHYPNLFLGFAVLLQNWLATLGSDGRLRLSNAGRQAEHDEWLEGWR